MRNISIICFVLFGLHSLVANAQEENKYIRQGNAKYDAGKKDSSKYDDAIVLYKKALELQPQSFSATFNLGDALFQKKKYDEAIKEFSIMASRETNKMKLSHLHHNIGNCYYMMGKLDEAENEYKKALRNNPYDKDTKYNLALIQSKKNNPNNNNKQNKDKNKDNKQDQNKNQNKDKNKDNQNDKQQQNQQPKSKISKQDAQRILEALQNDEKKTQEKVRSEQKQKANSVRIEKEW